MRRFRKNAIFDELFRRGYEEFGRWMHERPFQDGPIRDNWISATKTYMGFAQQNPDLYQLMFQRPLPGFVPSEKSMAVSWGLLAAMGQQLDSIFNSDQIQTNLPADEARDLMIAMTHGPTELHLANNPDLPVGEGRYGKLELL